MSRVFWQPLPAAASSRNLHMTDTRFGHLCIFDGSKHVQHLKNVSTTQPSHGWVTIHVPTFLLSPVKQEFRLIGLKNAFSGSMDGSLKCNFTGISASHSFYQTSAKDPKITLSATDATIA